MSNKIIIGSRGSDLALWQANFVTNELSKKGIECELKIIKTQGDIIQHLSFDKMEGKGFFTKEIEEHLLNGSIDLAVHSHKDLETVQPDDLMIAGVSSREDPSELLLIKKDAVDESRPNKLKLNAIVGTSSARRKCQLLETNPDIVLKDLRGNVPTRINKLRTEKYDAIMLAKAGVSRLLIDLSEFYVLTLDPTVFVPAPAQGALGYQVRKADKRLIDIVSLLDHPAVKEQISVERRVLNLFQGGCQLPLGVYCEKENNTFKVWSKMAKSWDAPVTTTYKEGNDMETLAAEIVESLLKKKES
ncbi:MAG: hydroxymethylbilane synthase [Flavobacteriales bacterium]|jgi:hydroxymethylbilane synthase